MSRGRLRAGDVERPYGRTPLLRSLGLAAGAVGALGAGTLRYLLRRPLPRVDGEVHGVRGLNGPVEVVRDRWGVPHITAHDECDAQFALGFCHGQDRLWQMELQRRLACGELAEILGGLALDVDRFMRRLGLQRAAARELAELDAPTRECLEAYVAGVNAAINQVLARGRLPLEYSLLRFLPRPWQVLDTLSFARYFAFTQSPNWESELIRSRLIARMGYAEAAALEVDVWQPEGDSVPRLEDWGPPRMPTLGNQPPVDLSGGPGGSNCWVVSGARSSTGKPLLANDPHLFHSLPSVFYEAQLVGGSDLNVIGATAPGIPGVLIGHNRQIAWGFTASMADVQDLYVERLHPGDPSMTEFRGTWEAGEVVRETILVKGRAEPWFEEVLLTRHHGPLLTPTPALADEHRPLSLRSTALEARATARGCFALNRAANWEEFRAALEHWGTPSLNALYADVEGNIGWQLVGRIPIRARGQGLVPSPGWSGEYEWQGEIPYQDLPHVLNPSDGLWANANHNATRGSRHFFTAEYEDPARYQRIRQVLESKDRHSAVDFGALQADRVSLPARAVAALLGQHLDPAPGLEMDAVVRLRAWDGRVDEDSAAAAIYEVFRTELMRARYSDALGTLLPAALGVGPHPVFGAVWSRYFRMSMVVEARVRAWAAARESDADVPRAFRATVRLLREKQGTDVSRWSWGRLHTFKLSHALSVQKPLGAVLDVPAFPLGGDHETVHCVGLKPGAYEAAGPTAGYRFIADTSDWDASLGCIPGGQSGHRGSPHYADQLDDWRRVAYHPMPFTRPAVSRYARHTLTLHP